MSNCTPNNVCCFICQLRKNSFSHKLQTTSTVKILFFQYVCGSHIIENSSFSSKSLMVFDIYLLWMWIMLPTLFIKFLPIIAEQSTLIQFLVSISHYLINSKLYMFHNNTSLNKIFTLNSYAVLSHRNWGYVTCEQVTGDSQYCQLGFTC